MEWFKVQRSIGDKWAVKIARAYRDGVHATESKTDWSAVEEAIPHGTLAVYNAIQWNTWDPVSNISKAYNEMYKKSEEFLQKYEVTKADISIEMGPEYFTMPNPAAEAWLYTFSSSEVKEIYQQDMDNIRQILGRGQKEKQTYKKTAKQIRDAIGLNSKQEIALNNYVNKLTESGKTEAQIQSLEEEYYNKMLNYRSETIALTESHSATNKAWSDSVRQAVRDDILDPKVFGLYWMTAEDKRTCDICHRMNGVEGNLETQSFDGHAPPPTHPRCRCNTVIRRKK